MWDNRAKKESGEFKSNRPDYSCKNRECKGAIWPPKTPQPAEHPAVAGNAKAEDTFVKGIGYSENLKEAAIKFLEAAKYSEQINEKFPGLFDPTLIATTLFTAANK